MNPVAIKSLSAGDEMFYAEQAVNDLAARVDRAQHSMSKHLQMLRAVGA
jgi:predicted transcriptional regulator